MFVDGATHSLAGNLLILSYSPSHGSHGDLFQCGKAGLLLVIRTTSCTIAQLPGLEHFPILVQE